MSFGYDNYKESKDKTFSFYRYIDGGPGSLDDDDDRWLESYLVDRLKQHLAIVEFNLVNDYKDNLQYKRVFNLERRKYYNRAHHFLKIGAFKPVPNFVVNLSDLTPRLKKELYELDNEDLNYVLRQAVGRIFEDVNSELYHNSLSCVLKVKLEK
jgi:hypothetical protein